ncbi:MAG: methionyl-tRNA formyltransferase [Patescibacteria group bacterium]|jgi:methionyl-tRNA formyltransferase
MISNKKIIFWGTPSFSLPSLEELHKLGLVQAVVTQVSKPAGRGRKMNDSPVKLWADKEKLPVLALQKLDDNFIKEIKKYLPATFVVVAYGKIIKQDILNLSELPAINIHPSKLPEFRGPSPIQATLLAGEKKTAVTLMQLDEKMDHGPIIKQSEVRISEQDNFITLSDKLAKAGALLLKENIIDYLEGKSIVVAQDDTQATICGLIQKEDGLINWNESADVIKNKIRAYNPWPSAYTKLSGLEIKIMSARISQKKLKPAELSIEQNHLYLGTDTTALEILELQPAGKKIMSAQDFIRGFRQK